MPQIDDYSADDPENKKPGTGYSGTGSSGGGGGSGPAQQSYSPQKEAPTVNWSQLSGANQDVANREAGKLATGVQAGTDSAMSAANSANVAFDKTIQSNYQQPAAQAQPGNYGKTSSPGFGQTSGWEAMTGQTQTAGQRKGAKQQGQGSNAAGNPMAGQSTTATVQAPAAPQSSQSWGDANAAAMGTGWTPAAPTAPPPGTKTFGAGTGGVGAVANAQIGKKVDPQLTANALANGPQGPKDLQDMMGASGWGALTGQLQSAQEAQQQLGTQTGVQALLQQNQQGPVTGTDAALISGQGGNRFQTMANGVQGNPLTNGLTNSLQSSQDKWSQLSGQISAAQQQQKDLAAKQANDAQVQSDNARGSVDLDPNAQDKTAKEKALTDAAAPFLKKVGVFGDKAGMLGALDNDTPNSKNFDQHSSDSIKTMLDQLGISAADLRADITKMTDAEYTMFITAGFIPQWMNVGNNKRTGQPPLKGSPRGWSGFASDQVYAGGGADVNKAQGEMNAKQYEQLISMWLQMLAA